MFLWVDAAGEATIVTAAVPLVMPRLDAGVNNAVVLSS
jgi:hypothetical protein